MRRLNRRNSAMTSGAVGALATAAASAARASARCASGSRNRHSARLAGSRNASDVKIGGAGKGGREQLPDLRRLGKELGGSGEIGSIAKRLGQAFKHVGAPRRIVDARAFGDALEERRHAGLISAPAGAW